MPKSKKKLAAEAKREYMRKWRAENKDRIRKYNETYWLKQAKQLKESSDDVQHDSKADT